MRISAKIDYACRALLELALHWPSDDPVQINVIAKNQVIPIKFLTQILINLKQLGLVRSIRGKNGGYLLTQPPNKIRLSDLVECMGGLGGSTPKNRFGQKTLHVMDGVWQEVDNALLKVMEGIDFETICNRKRSRDDSFIFQI